MESDVSLNQFVSLFPDLPTRMMRSSSYIFKSLKGRNPSLPPPPPPPTLLKPGHARSCDLTPIKTSFLLISLYVCSFDVSIVDPSKDRLGQQDWHRWTLSEYCIQDIDRESDTLSGIKQRNSAANFKLPDDCVQIYLAEAKKEEHKICQINASQSSTEELLTAFL